MCRLFLLRWSKVLLLGVRHESIANSDKGLEKAIPTNVQYSCPATRRVGTGTVYFVSFRNPRPRHGHMPCIDKM